MKKLLVCFGVFFMSFSVFASGKRCAYFCDLVIVDPSSSNVESVVFEAEDFRPIGGYTSELNTTCIAKSALSQKSARVTVRDVFGAQTVLTMFIDGKIISTESPAIKGRFTLNVENYALTCVRP